MKLSVSEASKLMGISVRTLHYYDEIGLLKPSDKTEAGYRYYDDNCLAVLQQILFYRELELPLKEIRSILSQPDHDQTRALASHRELLLIKQRHVADMLRLVDETLGGENMSKSNFTFDDYEEAKDKYATEAKARWGHTKAYKESQRHEKNRTEAETLEMMNETNSIFTAFAKSMDLAPSSPEVQALVARWQALITMHHYNCTNEILDGLAEMYIGCALYGKHRPLRRRHRPVYVRSDQSILQYMMKKAVTSTVTAFLCYVSRTGQLSICFPRKPATVWASLYSTSPRVLSPSEKNTTQPMTSPSEIIGAAVSIIYLSLESMTGSPFSPALRW